MSPVGGTYDDVSWSGRPEEYDEQRRRCWLNERRTAYIEDAVSALGGERHVLELGSGTGWLLLALSARFPAWRFTGVDPLESYIAYAEESARRAHVSERVSYVQGSAEALAELVHDPADVMLSNDVLHHVDDLAAVARAAYEVAAPGARWLAIEPNAANPYVWLAHKLRSGEATFPSAEFVRIAERSGWRLLRRQPLFLIPSAVMSPPEWAKAAERCMEHRRLLAGGIAIELERVAR